VAAKTSYFDVPNSFDYSEATMMKSYIKNATTDIDTTAKRVIEDRTHREINPLVKPLTDRLDAGTFRAIGALGVATMLLKWSGDKPDDRKKEMLAAQLIEAYANHHNGDDWSLEYGFNF
jgi:hypothetical protein